MYMQFMCAAVSSANEAVDAADPQKTAFSDRFGDTKPDSGVVRHISAAGVF